MKNKLNSAPGGNQPGALYVLGTPIGNLGDITIRALDILRDVDMIASEDTRTTQKLLAKYDIHTPLTSYHQHSGGRKAREIVEIMKAGASVALVSEAGTPGISDPGHELIRLCIDRGISIVPVPGASAFVCLLSVCGFNTNSFVFLGFPPRKPGERTALFESLKKEARTLVFYESPGRILATLKSMQATFGNRNVCLGRELTKLHEEIWRGVLSEAINEFTKRRPRGEFAIVLEGAGTEVGEQADIETALKKLLDSGMDEKSALSMLAKTLGVPRRQVYTAALKLKGRL